MTRVEDLAEYQTVKELKEAVCPPNSDLHLRLHIEKGLVTYLIFRRDYQSPSSEKQVGYKCTNNFCERIITTTEIPTRENTYCSRHK